MPRPPWAAEPDDDPELTPWEDDLEGLLDDIQSGGEVEPEAEPGAAEPEAASANRDRVEARDAVLEPSVTMEGPSGDADPGADEPDPREEGEKVAVSASGFRPGTGARVDVEGLAEPDPDACGEAGSEEGGGGADDGDWLENLKEKLASLDPVDITEA